MIVPLLVAIFFWRVGLFVIAFFAPYFLPEFGNSFPYWREILVSTSYPDWLWSWGNFDGVHYLTIAKSGYSAQYTQAFFPFYPLLIQFITSISHLNAFLSALLLSNIFFIFFLYLFILLMKMDGLTTKQIQWTILFVLLFPFSFYFGAIYNESLFMTLVIGSFIASRKKMWALSGLLGLLASLSRFVGIFLFPALIIELYLQRGRNRKQILFHFLCLLLIPCGLLFYMIYLQIIYGDALYFVHAQSVFGASRSISHVIFLPQVIWRYLKIFLNVPHTNYFFWVAMWEFVSFILFLTVIIFNWKKIRLSYLVFCLLAGLVPTLTGTFSSIPRYILVVFPLYILHGSINSSKAKVIIACLYGFMLAIFTVLFVRGYWVS